MSPVGATEMEYMKNLSSAKIENNSQTITNENSKNEQNSKLIADLTHENGLDIVVKIEDEDSMVSFQIDENVSNEEFAIKKEEYFPDCIIEEDFTYIDEDDGNSITIRETDNDAEILKIEYSEELVDSESHNEDDAAPLIDNNENIREKTETNKTKRTYKKSVNIVCPHCERNYRSEKSLQTHIDIVHLGKLPYICEVCGISFKVMSLLKEHILLHSNERPFICDVCDKSFKTKMRLNVHKDIHGDTKYVCPDCGRLLNSKRTLNMHRKTHTNEKKFKCEYCGSIFAAMKGLKNHIIMHTGIKPYACNFCERRFAYGSSLRCHKKESHPAELAELEKNGETHQVKPNIPSLDKLLAFTRAAARGEVKAVKSQKRVYYRYNTAYVKS